MRFSIYQMSRLGGRETNQDCMGYCYSREAALFVVADGMGGHPEGDVAAQIALQTMAARFQREMKPTVADPGEFLRLSVLMAHQQILRYAQNKGMHDSPRTTIVLCLIQHGVAYWAHVGDSRLYLVRKNGLLARTRDHSHFEALKAHAMPDAALAHVNRNVLYSCLGSPSPPEVQIHAGVTLEVGDTVLLCSDGLWSVLDESRIVSTLATRSVVDAVPELIDLALKTAGDRSDNVTGLAFEWEGIEEETDSGVFSTMDLAEDAFASTIAPSTVSPEGGDDELDDAAIERSIAEIREAIERTTNKRGGS
jgi:serine/threonine protein phosphatase PrpC